MSENQIPNPIRCTSCNLPLAYSPFPEDRGQVRSTTCQACIAFEAYKASCLVDMRPGSTVERRLEAQREDLKNWRRYWCHREKAFADAKKVPERFHGGTWRDVSAEVKAAIPSRVTDALRDGFLPKRGFGLLGGIGVGKSGALATLIPSLVARTAWRRSADVDAALWGHDRSPRIFWADWPNAYSDLQRRALDGDFTERLQSQMIQADLLILDDLGREGLARADGSTAFGHRILNDIISRRNGDCKATWWTSNVELEHLLDLYDGSMVSRLLEDNPPYRVCNEARNRRLPH